MTTDRLFFFNHLHAAKDRPRVAATVLVLLITALLSLPAGALADEYIPSGGEGGNKGGGGTPNDGGSFSVPGVPKDSGEPAPVETTETPATPVGPTPEEQAAAEKQARKEAKEKKERQKAKEAARKAKKEQKQLEKQAALDATQSETPTGTQTAADVARTAFEGDDAGPLPIVLGVLLLVTGIGLVIRYRRTGRSS